MSRARDVADSQDNLGVAIPPAMAGKNFAINGGFDIWQRGTSISVSSTAFYAADRWYASGSGGSTISVMSQQTSGAPIGTSSYARIAYSTNSTFLNLFSPFEYANLQPLQGQTVTLSFKGRRNSSYSGGLVAGIQTGTVANTLLGGTWTEVANCVISNANLPTGTTSSDWGSASVSFTIPAGTQGLRIRIGEEVVQASGAYYEVGAIQLELGSKATPFSRAGGSIGGELALCQRYYWRSSYGNSGSSVRTAYGISYSSTIMGGVVPLPVSMRTIPTSIDYSGLQTTDTVNFQSVTNTSIVSSNSSNNLVAVDFTVASGLIQFRPYYVTQTSSSGYFGLSAEL